MHLPTCTLNEEGEVGRKEGEILIKIWRLLLYMPKAITKGLMYTCICPYVYKYFFLFYFFQFHIRIKKNPLPFKYVEILPGFEFKLGQEKNIFGPSSPEEQHGFAEKTIALEKQVCIRHIWRNHQYFH